MGILRFIYAVALPQVVQEFVSPWDVGTGSASGFNYMTIIGKCSYCIN